MLCTSSRIPFAVALLMAAAGLVAATVACITRQPPTDTVASVSSVTGPTAVTVTPGGNDDDDDSEGPSGSATASPTVTSGTASAPATVTVAYQPDMKPAFDADCVRCHSGSRPDGGYSMVTYAQIMRAVSPGNAASILIRFTQRGGSMYRYWSGNAQAKADLTRAWIVDNAAAETR